MEDVIANRGLIVKTNELPTCRGNIPRNVCYIGIMLGTKGLAGEKLEAGK